MAGSAQQNIMTMAEDDTHFAYPSENLKCACSKLKLREMLAKIDFGWFADGEYDHVG